MTYFLLALLACSAAAPTLTPESAARLADEIAASPATADTILSNAGTDPKTFEGFLFTVAEDPDLTRRYLAARR